MTTYEMYLTVEPTAEEGDTQTVQTIYTYECQDDVFLTIEDTTYQVVRLASWLVGVPHDHVLVFLAGQVPYDYYELSNFVRQWFKWTPGKDFDESFRFNQATYKMTLKYKGV